MIQKGSSGAVPDFREESAPSATQPQSFQSQASARARTDPPDMQSTAYQVVCGVREYAELRGRGFGSREQAQYLSEGVG